MNSSDAIDTLTRWLDAVNVATAGTRTSRIVDAHFAREAKRSESQAVDNDGIADGVTCLHEAAHAVVGHYLGRRIRRAFVRGREGAVEFERDTSTVLGAVTQLAGPACELLLARQASFDYLNLVGSFDLLAARLAIAQSPPELGFSTRAAVTWVIGVVTERWPKIERVAAKLRGRGSISGAEVSAQ